MRIAILVSKPSFVRLAIAPASTAFPDATLDFVVCFPMGAFGPHLPRGLSWSDYPHIAPFDEHRFGYRQGPSALLEALVIRVSSSGEHIRETGQEVIKGTLMAADEVIVMVDPCAADMYHADVMLKKTLGRGIQPGEARMLYDSSAPAIERAFKDFLSDDHNKALRCISHGQVRHYFHHQFAANSLSVLNKTLSVDGWISKYQIQALYLLADQGPLNLGGFLMAMTENRGTGKYKTSQYGYEGSLGSAMSKATIVEQLVEHGWVDRNDNKKHMVSAEGQRVIEALHPGCKDLDLPFRLEAWSQAGLPASKAAMDRYIRTFFGRQKRFWEQRRKAIAPSD